MATNEWCKTLGIEQPVLDTVKRHREASTYSLLIVALLERGEAMTLVDVADRFEEAGIAHRDRALLSLKRCRPGRAPIYRDGDFYSLDPHDDDLDLWAFRLGLRPPKVPRFEIIRPEPPPLPGIDVPLSLEELDVAWKNARLYNWSAQRLALAVLDAHERALLPGEVVSFVAARTRWHGMRDDSIKFKRRGCPIAVNDDGSWSIARDADDALMATRKAVRAQLEKARSYAAERADPAVCRAQWKAAERRQDAHARELAAMSRVLLEGFPSKTPRAIAILDVERRDIATFMEDEFAALRRQLTDYKIIGAQNVRALLRNIDFEPDGQRLAELGPPQQSKKLNKSGRTLKITTTLLVQGSCGIARPFGDPKKLAGYLAKGEHTKLRRRLEADVKSLYALYEYGRLHGVVRLRWGFLNERIPAPWVHQDEQKLYSLKKAALKTGATLDVVVGSAPGWGEPWSRARHAHVEKDPSGWQTCLVDSDGYVIDEAEVQRARIVGNRDDSVCDLVERLSPALIKLSELRSEAERAGVFIADRGLLSCTGCGLTEDILADGRLITFRGDSRGSDTSLRFKDLGDEVRFRCPSCGAVVVPEDDDV